MNTRMDEDGLILPKKIMNPCLESRDRQDLHRELIFNQKIGKNVLNQKTELQRELQKRKERISQHNRDNDNNSTTTTMNGLGGIGQELAKEIARRNVRNIEGNSSKSDETEATLNEEYLRIKSSLKHNRINNTEI